MPMFISVASWAWAICRIGKVKPCAKRKRVVKAAKRHKCQAQYMKKHKHLKAKQSRF